METHDLCKMRIEDFARSHESLRSMEWKIYFQVYAGYGVIAIAYDKARAGLHQHPNLALGGALIATLGVCVAGLWLLSSIHKRQRIVNDLKFAYFDELQNALGFKPNSAIVQIHSEWAKLPRWWATGVQHVLSIGTAVGLIAWQVSTRITT